MAPTNPARELQDPLLPRSARPAAQDSPTTDGNPENTEGGFGTRGHVHPARRQHHSLPLGSSAVDVRAVARRGFRPLHGATPVLVTWAFLCVLCVVVVCVPSHDKRVAAAMGPFKDYRARAALNTALLFASGALELLLR